MCDQELTKEETLDLLNTIKDVRVLLEKVPAGTSNAENLREAIRLMESCVPKRFQVFL